MAPSIIASRKRFVLKSTGSISPPFLVVNQESGVEAPFYDRATALLVIEVLNLDDLRSLQRAVPGP